MKKSLPGLFVCLVLALPAYFLGHQFPVVGGPVLAIALGMALHPLLKKQTLFGDGIKFTSKKVLQYAVILLGFGMDLKVVVKTGGQSLPIILSTITVSLLIAYALQRALHMPAKISTLVGVGSSI